MFIIFNIWKYTFFDEYGYFKVYCIIFIINYFVLISYIILYRMAHRQIVKIISKHHQPPVNTLCSLLMAESSPMVSTFIMQFRNTETIYCYELHLGLFSLLSQIKINIHKHCNSEIWLSPSLYSNEDCLTMWADLREKLG